MAAIDQRRRAAKFAVERRLQMVTKPTKDRRTTDPLLTRGEGTGEVVQSSFRKALTRSAATLSRFTGEGLGIRRSITKYR
jgi:hypothetical protein